MLYFRRKDGNGIIPDEILLLSRYLNACEGPVGIPEWGVEVPDIKEALGKVLLTPYNVKTIGIPQNGVPGDEGPYRRNKLIAMILECADYYVTGMPHESWSRKQITEFMGLSEEELGGCCIYLPPAGGNPIDEIRKDTKWKPNP